MGGEVRVALSATTQPWRALLYEHIRDHVVGMTATTVREMREIRGDQRQQRGGRRFDVVVLDDVMRIFNAAEVGAAKDRGTRFIGLFDLKVGRGQPYLVDLDVDMVLPATTQIVDLVAAIQQLSPIGPDPDDAYEPPSPVPPTTYRGGQPRRRGVLTVISRSCGGVGSTETTIAVTDQLSRAGRALMIEADELAPSAAARLSRDPDWGLARALGRIAHGHRALPDGLSPPARNAKPLDTFDIICGTSLPGGPPIMNPAELVALTVEALDVYDHVVVETNVLIGGSSEAGRDRFAAARDLLARADRIVVIGRPDGEGATSLVNWLSAASSVGAAAPVWAVFGRAPRKRYLRARLAEHLVDHVGQDGFAGVHYLPEDAAVGKAKWNGELVRGGRWLSSLQRLVTDLAVWTPRQGGTNARRASGARQRIGAQT
jgi:hypothetical protein